MFRNRLEINVLPVGGCQKREGISLEGHFFIIVLSLLLHETTKLLWLRTFLEVLESDASEQGT